MKQRGYTACSLKSWRLLSRILISGKSEILSTFPPCLLLLLLLPNPASGKHLPPSRTPPVAATLPLTWRTGPKDPPSLKGTPPQPLFWRTQVTLSYARRREKTERSPLESLLSDLLQVPIGSVHWIRVEWDPFHQLLLMLLRVQELHFNGTRVSGGVKGLVM